MSYQGWSNYETWAVALWLDNEYGSYCMAVEMAEEAWRDAEDPPSYLTRSESARLELADALKGWQDEMMPDLDASVWSDLMSAAYGEVDWLEIAEHYLGEMAGYEPANV